MDPSRLRSGDNAGSVRVSLRIVLKLEDYLLNNPCLAPEQRPNYKR
jgi:hypothetical protein